MQIKRLIFLSVIIFLFSTCVEAQIQTRVKFGEIANLTYQLDCVGDLPVYCSRQNLGDLWAREFLKTDEDRRMLKEWARLRDLYSKSLQISDDANQNVSAINLFDKIRIAGFQATSVEDYAQKLDLLTAPTGRASFERVVRHFEPRFKIWWQTEAIKEGDEFAKQTDALLRSPKLSDLLKQFYDFYAASLPAGYELSFNLFYTPNLIKESSNGQQLENYSLMEFRAKENPAQHIDVAVHELCHFFYENMKPDVRARLEQRFRQANRAAAIPAYNLLNESLAAAFGNGMIARSVTPAAEFEKYVAAKKSFYNSDSIDRAAKAILPMLDARLKNGKTIDDTDFVNDYTAALEKSFGENLLTPKLYLSEMFLFVDAKYGVSMRRDVRRILETASFYAAEGNWTDKNVLDDYKNQPRLNSVIIVHPDNLGELTKNKIVTEAQLKLIQTEYEAKQQALFSATREPFTYVYIAVARDADAAKKLIENWQTPNNFRGFIRNNQSARI